MKHTLSRVFRVFRVFHPPRLAASLLAASLLATTLPAGAATASAELKAFQATIRSLYDLKEKAFASQDADAIVDRFYAPDVISTGEETPVKVGREQLRPMYRELVKYGDVRIESVYTKVSGNMGWDWANFHVKPRDPAEKPFTFRILFLWEKVNGKWMSAGDMYVHGTMQDRP